MCFRLQPCYSVVNISTKMWSLLLVLTTISAVVHKYCVHTIFIYYIKCVCCNLHLVWIKVKLLQGHSLV